MGIETVSQNLIFRKTVFWSEEKDLLFLRSNARIYCLLFIKDTQ